MCGGGDLLLVSLVGARRLREGALVSALLVLGGALSRRAAHNVFGLEAFVVAHVLWLAAAAQDKGAAVLFLRQLEVARLHCVASRRLERRLAFASEVTVALSH